MDAYYGLPLQRRSLIWVPATTGVDLSKILGGQTKILGGQKVVKSDKCMGVSQLLSTPMLDA